MMAHPYSAGGGSRSWTATGRLRYSLLGAASLAFDQILENAEGNTEIITRLLQAIEQIAEVARNTRRRHILLPHGFRWVVLS